MAGRASATRRWFGTMCGCSPMESPCHWRARTWGTISRTRRATGIASTWCRSLVARCRKHEPMDTQRPWSPGAESMNPWTHSDPGHL
eukprot:366248-Chlamydomonas_euryale.AAC.8